MRPHRRCDRIRLLMAEYHHSLLADIGLLERWPRLCCARLDHVSSAGRRDQTAWTRRAAFDNPGQARRMESEI